MPHRRIESVRCFGSDIVMVYGGNCQWQTLHFVYSEKKIGERADKYYKKYACIKEKLVLFYIHF